MPAKAVAKTPQRCYFFLQMGIFLQIPTQIVCPQNYSKNYANCARKAFAAALLQPYT